MAYKHIPVLKDEVLEYLNIRDGGVYVDCTSGMGGHISGILALDRKDLLIVGIDRDPENCKFLEEKFLEDNVKIASSDYKFIDDVLSFYKVDKVDGILFDLGFSSIHIDDPARGFSLSKDGPLDMRYNRNQKLKAEDVVNDYSPEDLERIIKEYGEESFYKNITKRIVEAREIKRITSTSELRNIVHRSIPSKFKRERHIDPATKVFQAIRIEVNSELESLRIALDKSVNLLALGGRLCVITFHSLEDRIVKRKIQREISPCTCPPGLPQCVCGNIPTLKWIVKNPIIPGKKEIEINPRSRSAKLRVAERI